PQQSVDNFGCVLYGDVIHSALRIKPPSFPYILQNPCTAAFRQAWPQDYRRVDDNRIQALFTPAHNFQFGQVLRFAIRSIQGSRYPLSRLIRGSDVLLSSDSANGTYMNQPLYPVFEATVYYVACANNIDLVELPLVGWIEGNKGGTVNNLAGASQSVIYGFGIPDIDVIPLDPPFQVAQQAGIATFPL